MNTLIPYLIVDDEPLARARIRRLMDKQLRFVCVGEANNSASARPVLDETAVTLIFLDISMPGESGLTFATELRQRFPRIKIVFLTAHPEYALEAFDLHANGYLVKPLREDKLMALLMTIFPEVETISYHVGNELRHVQLADVLVAQADDKYTRITLKSGTDALVDISLKALMDKFPTHFVQIHRSTLVNRNDIAVLESQGHKHFVGLKSLSARYEVSRRAYSQLKALL
ncbi:MULTISPECIES: LytTR family DNA-binding domain-containing protein [Pseudoalteromonas]|uniref:LytR/AlgR family response regulator transcription factor n=1 Tax=Pseudoalteromonas TaxID=53246 RepID=UPI000FFF601F|nr:MULTISPECIES: LytTR family DNA-binding domain-containing protein [Pseudoalteromonas]MDW7547828.1 LytTR family DNA-binding domain-containing protein [Pseudoalteromonas peptidolytica]RXF02225.1 DNA-binding response regulator [Pseudoalteromonas sp. PS5]